MNRSEGLRAAVIGTGFVGPHHADAVRRAGYADVVAMASSTLERARPAAERIGVAAREVADVVGDPAIDVVHICTPNATHVQLATAALEAGKHVVVEKPLALSSHEADRLVTLARERGLHAAVAFTYRGYPMVRRARREVAAGRLGGVRMAHGSYLQDWLLETTDYNWRVEPQAAGPSRAVADIGSHWFDTVEFVTGLRVHEVFADLHTFVRDRVRPAQRGPTFGHEGGAGEVVHMESEDAASVLIRFANGAAGSFVVSQVSPGHGNDFWFELTGERASLAWRQEDPDWLRIGERGGGTTAVPREVEVRDRGVPSLPGGHPEGWSDALRDLVGSFYAAIVGGVTAGSPAATEAYPTFADGARAVRFVAAALDSARHQRWTSVG